MWVTVVQPAVLVAGAGGGGLHKIHPPLTCLPADLPHWPTWRCQNSSSNLPGKPTYPQ